MAYIYKNWSWPHWENLFPARNTFNNEFTSDESIHLCSELFQRLWKNDKNILNVMNKNIYDNPVSLFSVHQFNTRLEQWLTSPFSEMCLTLPPSLLGFHQAIAHEIKNNTSLNTKDGSFAVALLHVYPYDVYQSLSLLNEDELLEDWKILKKSWDVIYFKKKKDKPEQIFEQKTSEYINKEKIKEKIQDFTPQQKMYGEKIKGWLQQIDELTNLSIRKEKFDSLIKEDVIQEKGTGLKALNFWFEDILIPGLCTLSAKEMKQVLEDWPQNLHVSFNDPAKTVDNKFFWKSIRYARPKSMILNQVLPELLHTETWTNQTYFNMLSNMIKNTEKYDWLFEERLQLWMKLGGNLNSSVPQKEEEKVDSMFDVYPKMSIKEWLKNQNVENWSNVIQKYDSKTQSTLKF